MTLNQLARLCGWVILSIGIVGYNILNFTDGSLDRQVSLLGSAVSGLFALTLVPKDQTK